MLSTGKSLRGPLCLSALLLSMLASQLPAQLIFNQDATISTRIEQPVHVVDGPADLYVITLWELSNDGADGTKIVGRAAWESPTRRLLVDKTLLKSGSSYVLAVYTSSGAPNAATGDMVTVSYP